MDALSLTLTAGAAVLTVFGVVLSVMFYKWGSKQANDATRTLTFMQVQVEQLAREIAHFRSTAEKERVSLTNRVLDLVVWQQGSSRTALPAPSVPSQVAPPYRAQSELTTLSVLARNLIRLQDDELLSLVGLHSLSLHFGLVEFEVLQHWTKLDPDEFHGAIVRLTEHGLAEDMGGKLRIPPDLVEPLAELFYVEHYDPAPRAMLNDVRERLRRVTAA